MNIFLSNKNYINYINYIFLSKHIIYQCQCQLINPQFINK